MLFGPDIDDTVKRLTTTYTSRGQVATLTSHSGISGMGDEVNQVRMAYNDFGQLVTDYQEHAGTVDTANSLKVEYGYAPGSDGSSETNQIRPTSITYPSGRQLEYNYGSTGSGTDLFNRIHAVRDGSTNLVEYKYLGGGRVVVADYTEPDLKLDLWGDTPGSYTGLDNFGRVVDQRWVDYAGSPVDAARLQYGYDRDGMPSYRKDTVAHALGAGFDELYGRDGLRRLNDYQRGQLNGTNDAISGGTLAFSQDWSLDQVANQTGLNQDSSGGGTDDLVQTRSHNTVNEITGITNTTGGAWSTPTYDAAGNTTRTPYPNNPMVAAEDVVLAYDAWNRVVKLTDAASPAATRNVYTYDARGFRIGNTLLSGDRLDHYYTAGWQCIEDRSNGALESQYVWGLRYIDDLVQRQRDTNANGTLDETTYALTDTQFNVVALSDTSGNIVQRIAYEPYGQPTFLTASYGASTNTRSWRYLFQGLRRHYGLYDNRNRLYDLLTGRFMQRDPLGYPDGMNLYAAYHVMYAGVDPGGMRLTWYHIASGDVDSAATGAEQQLRNAKEEMREALAEIRGMSNSDYDELYHRGEIVIGHYGQDHNSYTEETFTGSKYQLIALIENELKSSFTRDNNKAVSWEEQTDAFWDLIENQKAAHTFGNVTLYSQFMFGAHGSVSGRRHQIANPNGVNSDSQEIQEWLQADAIDNKTPICFVSCSYPIRSLLTYAPISGGAIIQTKGNRICHIKIFQIHASVKQERPDWDRSPFKKNTFPVPVLDFEGGETSYANPVPWSE